MDLHLNFSWKAKKNNVSSLDADCQDKKGLKVLFGTDKTKFENSVSRDWTIIFCISVLVFILIFVWSALIFNGTFSVEMDAKNIAQPPETTIHTGSLEKIVSEYEAKKKNFDILKQTPPAIVDPST